MKDNVVYNNPDNKLMVKTNGDKIVIICSKESQQEQFNFSKIKQDYLEEFQLMKLLINYGTTETIINNKTSTSVARFILLELELYRGAGEHA